MSYAHPSLMNGARSIFENQIRCTDGDRLIMVDKTVMLGEINVLIEFGENGHKY